MFCGHVWGLEQQAEIRIAARREGRDLRRRRGLLRVSFERFCRVWNATRTSYANFLPRIQEVWQEETSRKYLIATILAVHIPLHIGVFIWAQEFSRRSCSTKSVNILLGPCPASLSNCLPRSHTEFSQKLSRYFIPFPSESPLMPTKSFPLNKSSPISSSYLTPVLIDEGLPSTSQKDRNHLYTSPFLPH
jgi:hypothetical protein